MAFNFNWSPLIADTSRAREMLTNALNKSPKPPIIVDDIVVTELNLGTTPPSLEILEVGDLAEDRFRGIFKMVYSGDAFLTLKTRVQANPLNTYLSTKPSFASAQPLAAASGLTIPLAITLSDIRLSGFVILVFSKQKGITLVFRNDPLESLKVSSTFDSIPFVRDYLQKEIEKQLRLLFMEDLPAIIHRLSLRLFVTPDHQQASAELNSNTHLDNAQEESEKPIDPLSSPPQGPSLASDEEEEQSWFSLDDRTSSSSYSFSRKNLIRLAALNDSHRTLSLFTPPIRDVAYRAWAGSTDQTRDTQAGSFSGSRPSGLTLASLRNQASPFGTVQKAASGPSSFRSSSSDGRAPASIPGSAPSIQQSSMSSRPTLTRASHTTSNAYSTGGTLTSGASRPRPRKRKHRIVNLRKHTSDATISPLAQTENSNPTDVPSRPSTPTSITGPASSSWATESSREDDEIVTPPGSPEKKSGKQASPEKTPHASKQPLHLREGSETIRPVRHTTQNLHGDLQNLSFDTQPSTATADQEKPPLSSVPAFTSFDSKMPQPQPPSSSSPPALTATSPMAFPNFGGNAQPGGILEQAWLMKMAAEIARRAESERRRQNEDFWSGKWEGPREEESEPPPAYGTQ